MMKTTLTAAALLMLNSAAALAHISLKVKEARIGSDYDAIMRVPHGCEGKPTDTVRLRLPEGMIAIKPQSKPGWSFETVEGPYGRAFSYEGTRVERGITEIVWTGGSLDDKAYDEFTFKAFVATELTPGKTLYVPVIQLCGEEAERWIELPAEGQSSEDLEYPAPSLTLLPR